MPVKLNIFRMMAHAEANMIPAMRLGNSILHKQKLSAVNRELLILQAAQLEGVAYEWRQHVPIAWLTQSSNQTSWQDRLVTRMTCGRHPPVSFPDNLKTRKPRC